MAPIGLRLTVACTAFDLARSVRPRLRGSPFLATSVIRRSQSFTATLPANFGAAQAQDCTVFVPAHTPVAMQSRSPLWQIVFPKSRLWNTTTRERYGSAWKRSPELFACGQTGPLP